jgi:hypothetical protein
VKVKLPKFFFDYIYYTLTKFYFKWDGSTGITAIVAISMIQVCLVGDVLALTSRLIYERNETEPYSIYIGYFGAILSIILCIVNYYKYNGRYKDFRDYWQKEPKTKRDLKVFFVLLSLILPWIPLIIIGVYW